MLVYLILSQAYDIIKPYFFTFLAGILFKLQRYVIMKGRNRVQFFCKSPGAEIAC